MKSDRASAPSSRLPTFAMLGAVLLWSSATPASKLALLELPAGLFVVMRLSLAAVSLWAIVLVVRPDVRLRTVGWRPLVMGLLEPGLVTLLVSIGLALTSPVSGAVFWSLMPLLMPVLGRVTLGERIEGLAVVAAAIAFGGAMLLAWGQGRHGGGNILGDLLVATGVLASAFNSLIARRNAQAGANPLATASWQVTVASCLVILLLPLLPAKGQGLSEATPHALGALIYLGVVVSVGVYILSNFAYRHLPVAYTSLLGCLTAPFGALLSHFLLGTTITALDIFAIFIVIVAVALPTLVALRRSTAVT